MIRSLGVSAGVHAVGLVVIVLALGRVIPPTGDAVVVQAALRGASPHEVAPGPEPDHAGTTSELDLAAWPAMPDEEPEPARPDSDPPEPTLAPWPEDAAAVRTPTPDGVAAPSFAALRRARARPRAAPTPPPAVRVTTRVPQPTRTQPSRTQARPATAGVRAGSTAVRATPLRVLFAPDARHYYPRAARRARIEGRVLVRITIDPRGVVTHASVEGSSGVRLLDDAALALARAYRFTTAAQTRMTRLPVVFQLESFPTTRREG